MKQNSIIKYSIIVFILMLIVPAVTFARSNNSDIAFNLDKILRKYELFVLNTLVEWEVPGMAVAIVKDNNVVFMKCYGVREVGQLGLINTLTQFRIASASKGFASVLTGLLVQGGTLNWNDPVIKYLPHFSLKSKKNTKELTIQHILSHTTGLPKHTYTDLVEANVPYDKIVEKLVEVPVVGAVGKYYSYQNVMYSLISDIIKSATGKAYKQLLTERILKPLKMYHTSLSRDDFLATQNRASPHIRRNHKWKPTKVKQAYYNVSPSAGVNASISDMAKWLRALMGGIPYIISPTVLKQVTTPVIKTPRQMRRSNWRPHLRNAFYGLGWRLYNYGGTNIVYHGGWVEGYRSEIAFIPEQKIGIVVLMNFESRVANVFLPAFFNMYLGLKESDK